MFLWLYSASNNNIPWKTSKSGLPMLFILQIIIYNFYLFFFNSYWGFLLWRGCTSLRNVIIMNPDLQLSPNAIKGTPFYSSQILILSKKCLKFLLFMNLVVQFVKIVIKRCKHVFRQFCLFHISKTSKRCPMCNQTISFLSHEITNTSSNLNMKIFHWLILLFIILFEQLSSFSLCEIKFNHVFWFTSNNFFIC